MKMYSSLASWWPLISTPEEYREEAALFTRIILRHSRGARTLLELGAGGGNNASHMKSRFKMCLVDLEPGMLDVSRSLNPECEHIQGDMRTLRLGRTFDAVFIHDAIMYLTDLSELVATLTTARMHCRDEGCILVMPDVFKDSFDPGTSHGGRDIGGRSLRYMEWRHDPDPTDSKYDVEYSFLIQEEGAPVRPVYDHHTFGLFSRAEWEAAGQAVGLSTEFVPLRYKQLPRNRFFGLLYKSTSPRPAEPPTHGL